ncbi:MAG: hypothetical protein ACKN9S_04355, partial [Pirellula sp.]
EGACALGCLAVSSSLTPHASSLFPNALSRQRARGSLVVSGLVVIDDGKIRWTVFELLTHLDSDLVFNSHFKLHT